MVNVSINGIKFPSWILRNNFLGVKLCVAVLSLILRTEIFEAGLFRTAL